MNESVNQLNIVSYCNFVDSGLRNSKTAPTNNVQLIERLNREWHHSDEMKQLFQKNGCQEV